MNKINNIDKDPKSCLLCEFSGRPCYIDPCANCRNKSEFCRKEEPRKGEDDEQK